MLRERIKIPYGNWHIALADAIDNSTDGDVIEVHSDSMRELALFAKKTDVPFKGYYI